MFDERHLWLIRRVVLSFELPEATSVEEIFVHGSTLSVVNRFLGKGGHGCLFVFKVDDDSNDMIKVTMEPLNPFQKCVFFLRSHQDEVFLPRS